MVLEVFGKDMPQRAMLSYEVRFRPGSLIDPVADLRRR
jgi:hypothetical protein